MGIILLGFAFIGSVFSAERIRQGIKAHGCVQLKDLEVMSHDRTILNQYEPIERFQVRLRGRFLWHGKKLELKPVTSKRKGLLGSDTLRIIEILRFCVSHSVHLRPSPPLIGWKSTSWNDNHAACHAFANSANSLFQALQFDPNRGRPFTSRVGESQVGRRLRLRSGNWPIFGSILFLVSKIFY